MKILKEMLSVRMIKSLFLIIFGLIGLIIIFTISSFIINKEINVFITMLSVFTSLTGSIIALSIPFVMRYIDKKKEEDRINGIRWKSYEMLEKICQFALIHFDKTKNEPTNINEGPERTKITPCLEIMKTYKEEYFELGLIFIEIWKPSQADYTPCEIYIHILNSTEIHIFTQDFVKVVRIELKLSGEYVKDLAELSNVFNTLRTKLLST